MVVLVLAIGLFWKDRAERRTAEREVRDQLRQLQSAGLREGARFRDMTVVDPEGRRIGLLGSSQGSSRLLYLFKTDCPACAAQKRRWVELADLARGAGWQVTAVTSETLAPWVRSYFGTPSILIRQVDDPATASEKLWDQRGARHHSGGSGREGAVLPARPPFARR